LTKTEPAGTTTFTWNEENQLTQVTLPNGLTVSYRYDALGRRLQRTTNAGADERYVYDGADVLLDLNADWSVAATYLNGPGIDNHLRQTSATTGVAYFLSDHLGSTAALTDSAGSIVEQISYDSFGNRVGSSRTRYGYTGRERDPDTGQLYYRARFYDPQIGRFTSEDPIGLSGGINSFAYVHNNPLNATDPSGLYEIDVHYYLTYYLAVHSGCFNTEQARMIAEYDQLSDDDDDHAPGAMRAKRNADFHSLGTHAQNFARLGQLWGDATQGRGSLSKLGTYFHFLQDWFAHYDFAGNPNIGHGRAGHSPDHTNSDPLKALKMAQITWDFLNRFAKEKGLCCTSQDPDWSKVMAFINIGYDLSTVSGWYFNISREISDEQLREKIRILGVPWRSPDGRSRPR
jgi:RHS repeat-associated protein